MRSSVYAAGGLALALACATQARAAGTCGEATVQVILDMDAKAPGFQPSVTIPAGTAVVEGVSVYVLDPSESACVWGIGYLGGIDRGIALGHMPGDGNQGSVVALRAAPGAPLNPANFALVFGPPGMQPGFAGPELQYIEGGAAAPAIIPAAPVEPLFRADVVLDGAAAGDEFRLYLLDMVVVWTAGQGGAFSTQGFLTLDAGGDAVPDQTQTIYGVDPDAPLPVPPAAYLVDFIDGPQGATIRVVPVGDLDGDGHVGIVDMLLLLAAWGPCPDPPAACAADLDGDGNVGIVDFLALLAGWG
jgi:dockerin type I repeat protein